MGFDIGKLKDKFLAEGLPVIEDDLQKQTVLLFDWVKESIQDLPFPLSALAPIVDTLKDLALKAEDQIDGKVGV